MRVHLTVRMRYPKSRKRAAEIVVVVHPTNEAAQMAGQWRTTLFPRNGHTWSEVIIAIDPLISLTETTPLELDVPEDFFDNSNHRQYVPMVLDVMRQAVCQMKKAANRAHP